MIKHLGALCALAAALGVLPQSSFAQAQQPATGAAPSPGPSEGGGLLVAPTYVLLDSHTRSKALLLSNRGVVPETYRITIVNRRQMPDGKLVETDQPAQGEGFAGPLVRYSPHEIVLPPNRPQMVRLLLQMPGDLPDGEYRSHILFQEIPTEKPNDDVGTPIGNGLSVTIRAVFGVTIPLVVRKGNLTAQASLSDLELVRLGDEQQGLKLRLNRTGSRSLRGDLLAFADGDSIGKIINVTVFLSTPYREVTIPLTAPGDLKGRHITVKFTEGEDTPDPASATDTLAR